jgi:hypothetical protein
MSLLRLIQQKMSYVRQAAYLESRAARGSREAFDRVLAKVADVDPADPAID